MIKNPMIEIAKILLESEIKKASTTPTRQSEVVEAQDSQHKGQHSRNYSDDNQN